MSFISPTVQIWTESPEWLHVSNILPVKDILQINVMKFNIVVHSHYTTVHVSLENNPSVCLVSFISAHSRAKLQQKLRGQQHRGRSTQNRSYCHLIGRALFLALPSRLNEKCNSETGFSSRIGALSSQIHLSFIPLLPRYPRVELSYHLFWVDLFRKLSMCW